MQACLSPVCINMALALPGQLERGWWQRFPEGMGMDDLWKLAQAAWRLMVWEDFPSSHGAEEPVRCCSNWWSSSSKDPALLLSQPVFIPPESLSWCKTCCVDSQICWDSDCVLRGSSALGNWCLGRWMALMTEQFAWGWGMRSWKWGFMDFRNSPSFLLQRPWFLLCQPPSILCDDVWLLNASFISLSPLERSHVHKTPFLSMITLCRWPTDSFLAYVSALSPTPLFLRTQELLWVCQNTSTWPPQCPNLTVSPPSEKWPFLSILYSKV